MQQLIFFSTRKELGDVKGVNILDVPMEQRPQVLNDFEEGRLKTLLLPVAMCHGWRLNKLPEKLEVNFMGCSDSYYAPHRVSALNRLQGVRHAQIRQRAC